jgi:hypothetical protein
VDSREMWGTIKGGSFCRKEGSAPRLHDSLRIGWSSRSASRAWRISAGRGKPVENDRAGTSHTRRENSYDAEGRLAESIARDGAEELARWRYQHTVAPEGTGSGGSAPRSSPARILIFERRRSNAPSCTLPPEAPVGQTADTKPLSNEARPRPSDAPPSKRGHLRDAKGARRVTITTVCEECRIVP